MASAKQIKSASISDKKLQWKNHGDKNMWSGLILKMFLQITNLNNYIFNLKNKFAKIESG